MHLLMRLPMPRHAHATHVIIIAPQPRSRRARASNRHILESSHTYIPATFACVDIDRFMPRTP